MVAAKPRDLNPKAPATPPVKAVRVGEVRLRMIGSTRGRIALPKVSDRFCHADAGGGPDVRAVSGDGDEAGAGVKRERDGLMNPGL